MNEIVLSRKELYKKIWESPIRSIAQELGISDVGLAKICKRNGIPKPPQGYHLKKPGLAKDSLVRPLPPVKDEQLSSFTFNKDSEFSILTENKYEDEFIQYLIENDNDLAISDKKCIDNELKKLKSHINRKKVDERGIIIVPDLGFSLRVAPELFNRAELFVKGILSSFFQLRATIVSSKEANDKGKIRVNWLGYEFGFQVEENSKRIHVPKDKRPKRYGDYEWPADTWKLVPTGLLSLKVWGPGYGSISIRDGKRLIEERIDEVIKKMFIQAREKQEQERIEGIRMERAIAYLQEKDKVRQETEFQELRKKKLLRESREWFRAERLREYVAAIEDAGYKEGQAFESEADWNEWIVWAKEYIAVLNPITSGDAGKAPPYPEPKEITGVPYTYLQYDDPKEADEEMNKNSWDLY